MVDETTTTVQVSQKNWQRLNAVKEKPGDTMNDAISNLFDIVGEN